MKLNKDQKQKLVLGGMIVVGVIYAYFEFLLGPLYRGKDMAINSAKALDPKIAEAKAQLKKVEEMKKKEPETQVLLAQVKSMTPEGSPIAWFPPRMVEFFKKQGVEKVVSRLNNEYVEKDLPDFKRLNWGLETPRAEFVPFAAAVSALENEFPLVEVQGFDVEVTREDVGVQRAAITINHLIKL